jgi:hypothetical protein
MKKVSAVNAPMKSEYRPADLGTPVRGKYFKVVQKAKNVVILKPEIAKVFRDSAAVNEVLASLIKVAEKTKIVRARVSKASNKRAA